MGSILGSSKSGGLATVTFDAHFDGQHLCPDQPISLPTNVPLRVTVSERLASGERDDASGDDASGGGEPASTSTKGVFEQIAEKHGLIEGPVDWSAELDHYLYGTPKRGEQSAS